MYTRLLFLTALLIGFPLLAEAQGRGQRPGTRAGIGGAILGQVIESDTDDTLIGASVALWNAADSSLVTGTITRDGGRFELTGVRPGTYYVRVSFIGMVPKTVDDVAISRDSRRVDLGTVALAADTAQLDEIEVSARRDDIEFGIDRTRYTLRDQVVTAGGSALDALETVPSVEVDVDGAVSLRGSQNVAIHINGRPTQMSGDMLTAFLQGLQSESIEAVEVMPNPSVRYDPSGMSGILNIVLKENIELGWSANVSTGADSRGGYNASTGLNINYGRWSGTASYGFRSSDRDSEGSRYRLNRFQSPQTALTQFTNGNRESFSHNVRTSLRYDLSDKNELSFSGRVSLREGANYTLNANTFANGDDLLLRRYDRVTENSSDRFNMNYQLGFTRVLERNSHEFSAEVRWGMNRNDGQNVYREETLASADIVDAQELLEESSSRDRERSNASLRVDYERPLADWGKMETGYRGDMRTQDNIFFAAAFDPDLGAFLPQENFNNRFTYDRQVHAFYGIVQGETGRVGAQVGVRLEQTFSTFDLETTGEAFDNRYFSFFPNAYLTYSPTDGHQLKASYGKRINRPGTRSLNPFDDLSDPLFRRVGNPFLLPEYTHNIELSY
ncbi:MAG: TonB-dependent receptor, partial [Bacteroidetes bacterium]|nr:TonB-dependent receptor [Bacteroidota bacterium]